MVIIHSEPKISPHRISTCYINGVKGVDTTKKEQSFRSLEDEVLRRIIDRLEIDCSKNQVFRAEKTNMWMNKTYIENKIRIHHCNQELIRRGKLRRVL